MINTLRNFNVIYAFVFLSGMAALSWESVWQIKSALSLGVSSWGTALTLAITMGGMACGALATGRILKHKKIKRPLRLYGALEAAIGLCGLFLIYGFHLVQSLDSWVYAQGVSHSYGVHIMGIVSVLFLPTFCMGATLPVLGLMAQQYKVSLSLFYGLNTLGAAVGVMLAAFVLIPLLGISKAILVIAGLNFAVGILAWCLKPPEQTQDKKKPRIMESKLLIESAVPFRVALFLAFITGFATFMLEVAWFRSLTAAFMSTTEAFAIMLSCVLLALGIGARLAGFVKNRAFDLGVIVCVAGCLILLATPVIERFDLIIANQTASAFSVFSKWYVLTFYTVGAPVILMGMALPWILDEQDNTSRWGLLYGLNAFAAILGAVFAAWIFLPQFGFSRTAWFTGMLVVVAGVVVMKKSQRLKYIGAGVAALLIAIVFESGIGRDRVQNTLSYDGKQPHKILDYYEGPDATVSVVEYDTGRRALYIDGFSTTEQGGGDDDKLMVEHYMAWMGHLPMLLHPDPQRALVIAFGTGQTANAVRHENPAHLDVVDLNENVLKFADNFPANEDVLSDPRVTQIVMDGRAYMRRTQEQYDVITLEPMPPTFAGVNALYSKEFYEDARAKMTPDGVIAQWMPFHLVAAEYTASILLTFKAVFPNTVLWLDPYAPTGIIVGSVSEKPIIGTQLYGYQRQGIKRDLLPEQVTKHIFLEAHEIERLKPYGQIITDDNQLLAYGKASYLFREKDSTALHYDNVSLLNSVSDRKNAEK